MISKMGVNASGIHSGIEQNQREEVLRKFVNRELNVLVATDVMSRGIDIEGIDMVINYNVPRDAEDYIHRIGRTARASARGLAFTFVNEDDMGKMGNIEKLIGEEIRKIKLPDYIGDGPKYNPKRPDRQRNPFRKKKRKY